MRLKILILMSLALVCSCGSSPKKVVHEDPKPTAEVSKPVASQKDEPTKNEMICLRGTEKRVLDIEMQQPKGCKLWYKRYDTRSEIATSVLGDAYCEKVRDNVNANLTAAGFQCITARSGSPIKADSPSTPPADINSQKTKTSQK